MPAKDTGIAILEIEARGLREAERVFRSQQRVIIDELHLTMEEIGTAAASLLIHYAPGRTGHLKSQIGITGRNRSTARANIRVGGDIRDPETGYNYLPITRKGRGPVVAKRTSKPARTYNTGGRVGRGFNLPHPSGSNPYRASMLRFEPGPPGSGFIYRRRVRAYRPPRDWVVSAEQKIRPMAQRAMDDFTEFVQEALERYTYMNRRFVSQTSKPRPVIVRRF